VRFRSAPKAVETGEAPPTSDADDLRLLREAIEGLPVGVVVTEPGGRVIIRNRKATEPFGDVQADALAAEALRRVQAIAQAGIPHSESLELRGPVVRSLELQSWPLASGGTVAVVVDDSERRRLDAVRRDFVANVNHELRTPIGALGVLAEALEEEHDPTVVHRLTARIRGEVQRAHLVIEELLDFSRIDAETSVPSKDEVDLLEVATAAAERVAALADQRGVHISVEADDEAEHPTVLGSRAQLLSAVTNLVDTAVKFSDAGGSVAVAVGVVDGDATITVRDEGIGIPPKDLDREFERFYRVDGARDRRTGGTGLGLAIVRHVASNHGGAVHAESIEGAGSTFTVRIPRREVGA
jgi:two-component system sensor histidine kinase SenX3